MSSNIFGGYHLPANINSTPAADLSDYVTLDTPQTITGAKTLSNPDNVIVAQSVSTDLISATEGVFPEGVTVGDVDNDRTGAITCDINGLLIANTSPTANFSASAFTISAPSMVITDGSDYVYNAGMKAYGTTTPYATITITAFTKYTKTGNCSLSSFLLYVGTTAGMQIGDYLVGSTATTYFSLGAYVVQVNTGLSGYVNMSSIPLAASPLNTTFTFGRISIPVGSPIATNTVFSFVSNPVDMTLTNSTVINFEAKQVKLITPNSQLFFGDASYMVTAAYNTPTGTISMFGGTNAPTGYVLCNGAQYDRTNPLYAPLFNVIQLYFGGSAVYPNFFVPDFRGIYPGMPGTNTSHAIPGYAFTGPTVVGAVQSQSVPFIDHSHLTTYPNSTTTATSPGSQSFYKSGSNATDKNSSAAQGQTVPNTFTQINDYVKPFSLGINYIIKL